MVRTQIQLAEEQAARLKQLAAQRGISSAAVIREALDRTLATAPAVPGHERLLTLAGKYASGTGDISTRHDDYLGDAFDDSPA